MKLKTHKSAAKRFIKTGSGKIFQTRVGHQHLRHRKTSRMLSCAGGLTKTEKPNVKKISKLLPYL